MTHDDDSIPGPAADRAENVSRGAGQWERQALMDLAQAGLKEQRRARRWNIFLRVIFLTWLFLALIVWLPESDTGIELGKHTALVDVSGVIAADADASADNIVTGLRDAFENKNAKAVILRINSPGGSPVQAGYVNDEIIRLRNKYEDKPVYAVISDVCASGGYYIAAATDEIYADKASIVGSIGVVMDGFGFVNALDKLGIERRLMTAGEHKGFLDPFSPTRPEEVAHVQNLLDVIHKQFIDVVKNGRGEKLASNPDLFSGYVWSGEKSLELGLIDAFGSSSYVAREIVGAEKIVDYTVRPTYFERLTERLGTAMGKGLGAVFGGMPGQLR